MKVRFKHNNLKVFSTRISGKFNIYSEAKKEWNKKLTKGSFKINKYSDDFAPLYDKILEKITELKSIPLYTYRKHFFAEFDDDWRYYNYGDDFIHGNLIFTIENGIVKDAEVNNPKERLYYYTTDKFGDNPHYHIDFSSYSFNPKNRNELSELPKNVIDKMKEVDELYFKE